MYYYQVPVVVVALALVHMYYCTVARCVVSVGLVHMYYCKALQNCFTLWALPYCNIYKGHNYALQHTARGMAPSNNSRHAGK